MQRFVAYNNFGINFNLQSLLGSLIGVENVFKNKLNRTKIDKRNKTENGHGSKKKFDQDKWDEFKRTHSNNKTEKIFLY